MLIQSVSLVTALAFGGIISFASMVHGTIGIGLPLVATPLLAMFTDVRTAILLLVLPTIVINIANLFKGGQWRLSLFRYWPLAVYGIVGSLIGTRWLVAVPGDFFRPLLAIMLIAYLNMDRFGITFVWIRQYPQLAMAFSGLSAGILGGTVNVMLPALIVFALEVEMPKDVMIQVFNFCFLLGKLTQGVVFWQAGLFTVDIVYISIAMAVIGLMVMLFGMTIRDRIQTHTYRAWLKYLLAIMAIVLLVQFFWKSI